MEDNRVNVWNTPSNQIPLNQAASNSKPNYIIPVLCTSVIALVLVAGFMFVKQNNVTFPTNLTGNTSISSSISSVVNSSVFNNDATGIKFNYPTNFSVSTTGTALERMATEAKSVADGTFKGEESKIIVTSPDNAKLTIDFRTPQDEIYCLFEDTDHSWINEQKSIPVSNLLSSITKKGDYVSFTGNYEYRRRSLESYNPTAKNGSNLYQICSNNWNIERVSTGKSENAYYSVLANTKVAFIINYDLANVQESKKLESLTALDNIVKSLKLN
ncbi:MAG: hypothetical protein WCO33_02950 [bacterium]